MATQQPSTEQGLKKLEEQITCPICLEHSTNPKLLPCSHSFCLQCLKGVLVEGNHSINCPTCRSPCPVPDKGLASLPSSFIINNLIEVYELMKKVSDRQHVSCDNCDNANADRYCKQCFKFFCPDCLSIHNKWKPNASHELLNLKEVANNAYQLPHTKPDAIMSCTDHSKPLDIYCETCQQLICHNCTIKKHTRPEHDYDLVSDTYQQHKDTINQSSLQPLNKEYKRLEEAKQILVDKRKAISQQAEGTKEEIHLMITEAKSCLDETGKKLIEDVDSALSSKLRVLDHQLKDLDSAIGQVTECRDHVEHSIRIGSPQQVVLVKPQMMSRTQSVITSVEEKKFEPLEQPDIQLVKYSVKLHQELGRIKYTLNGPTTRISFDYIPLIKQQSTVTIHFTASDGSLVPVPSSLIKCRMTPPDSTSPDSTSPDNTSPIQCSVQDSSQSGQYDVVFTPFTRGLHQLHITVEGRNVPDSPISVPVTILPEMRGALVRTMTGLNLPSGVAVADNGHVVVSEGNGHRIKIFDREGSKIRSFGSRGKNKGQLCYPRGVVVTSKGTVLVADGNHRIQEFTMEGECISCVGTGGNGPLQFWYPRGIAISNTTGHVFIADTINHRIQVLHPDLAFSHMFGTKGSGQGQFNCPEDVAIDSQGFAYVTDYNHRVQKFNANGQFVSSFGTKGSSPGELYGPSGITVDGNDLLYVNNSFSNYVVVYTTDGEHVRSIDNSLEGAGCLYGIAIDSDDGLLVCCTKHNEIKVF